MPEGLVSASPGWINRTHPRVPTPADASVCVRSPALVQDTAQRVLVLASVIATDLDRVMPWQRNDDIAILAQVKSSRVISQVKQRNDDVA